MIKPLPGVKTTVFAVPKSMPIFFVSIFKYLLNVHRKMPVSQSKCAIINDSDGWILGGIMKILGALVLAAMLAIPLLGESRLDKKLPHSIPKLEMCGHVYGETQSGNF